MRALIALPLLVTVLAGCGAGGTTSADCSVVVRYQDREYVETGWVRRPGQPFGRAELAGCHDQGPDAPGAVFGDDATEVDVRTFPGVPARRAVGLREGRLTRVLVARGEDRDEVLAAVRRS